MKTLDIKKGSKISKILYGCATIMAICTIFTIYKSNTYISSLVSQGFDPTREILDVINYYLSTVMPFIFYTIALFSLGYISKQLDNMIKNQELSTSNNQWSDKVSAYEDDEIDDLFSNL